MDKIKEAVFIKKQVPSGCVEEHKKADKILFDLAEKVLIIEGKMPKALLPDHGHEYELGANNMRERCIIAMTKALSELERRTREDGDMADRAVNEWLRKSLGEK